MTNQEILKPGEAKPKEIRERYSVVKPLDIEYFLEDKETVREVYKGQSTGRVDTFIHTQKNGEDSFTRIKPGSEEPTPSTDEIFYKAFADPTNPTIEYEKYKIGYGEGCTILYSVCSGSLKGFGLAEVVFTDASKFDCFEKPEWLGEPVTGNPDFDNYSLATKGIQA